MTIYIKGVTIQVAHYSTMSDTHKHQCPKCMRVWEHGDHCGGCNVSHICPTVGCNGVQFRQYGGNTAPTFMQSCLPPQGRNEGTLESTVLLIPFTG